MEKEKKNQRMIWQADNYSAFVIFNDNNLFWSEKSKGNNRNVLIYRQTSFDDLLLRAILYIFFFHNFNIHISLIYSPLTVINCGFVSSLFSEAWTKATCAVICCELELFGDEAVELTGKIADTVIGVSSEESVWSIGTTSMIDTPSDVVPVWRIYFFYLGNNGEEETKTEKFSRRFSNFNLENYRKLVL